MLTGLRVLNTRPKEQAQVLSTQIRAAGGIAIEFPTIEIQEQEPQDIDMLSMLIQAQHAIFVSANAVHSCCMQLKRHGIEWPRQINVVALGEGTAMQLKKQHITVHNSPQFPDSEHVLALPCFQHIQQQTILIVKGEGGRTLLEQSLQQKGAIVHPISLYRRICPNYDPLVSNSLWQNDAVDIILLTSEQSLHHLLRLFDKAAHEWLKSKRFLVISARLAEIATTYGIKNIIMSHPNRIINTLIDYKD